ncbi:hypothetical protein KAFR_0H01660 [Kazachstania africana CBS 2517]|uniref:Reticulon-like protein n=1 Tax=Kazachstania africana (strain ATCC 22294 / BCRC 22015 / CBS 2517 / CECT 1963 / NBRC 1671 / NRRL Y-8276) TaxID=1071382 RepID=H2AZ20_KAZAF|nr:hypothetical protein KAFR_0H01660 [Kazachstania africana CBS 2517]CCF59576.1 hypothetical protein KAFR_0H01660 [Kazachstania africana CBS 2517]
MSRAVVDQPFTSRYIQDEGQNPIIMRNTHATTTNRDVPPLCGIPAYIYSVYDSFRIMDCYVYLVTDPSLAMQGSRKLPKSQNHTHSREQLKHSCLQNDLLLWKNPLKTCKYFLIAISSLLLFKFINNFISLAFKLFSYILFATGSIEFISTRVLGQKHGIISVFARENHLNEVKQPDLHVKDNVCKAVDSMQRKLIDLVIPASVKKTINTGLVLFILHKAILLTSVWSVALMLVIMLFTVPLFYNLYFEEVHSIMDYVYDNYIEAWIKRFKKKTDTMVTRTNEKLGDPVHKYKENVVEHEPVDSKPGDDEMIL